MSEIANILVSLIFAFLSWKVVPFLYKLWSIPTLEPCIPLFGSWLEMLRISQRRGVDMPAACFNLLDTFIKSRPDIQQLGLFKIWVGPLPFIFVIRPEGSEVLLRMSNLKKSFVYGAFDTAFGDGLVNANGPHHKHHRKLLGPAFDFKIIENFIPIMGRNIRTFNRILKEKASRDGGVVEDINDMISYCAVDILCETAMGVSVDAQSGKFAEADKALTEIGGLIMARAIQPWLLWGPLFRLTSMRKRTVYLRDQVLMPIAQSIYEERRNVILSEIDKSNGLDGKKAFLDILITENIKDPASFKEQDVFDELHTFLGAGYEALTTCLTWTFLLIGHHEHVQKKILDELDDIFQGDRQRDMTMDDMRRMTYVDAVLRESLRLYPPLPMIARDLDKDVTIGPVTLPKYGSVVIMPFAVHRCKDHWGPDAELFNPDRFLSGDRRHPYAFIPFSAGPRNCIGQKFAFLEAKSIISSFFRNFTLKSLIAIEQVYASVHITYKPISLIPVKIEERK